MSLIGQELNYLDTPALWVDLTVMEKNILYFSNYFKTANLAWRPHVKGIKIPAIAQMMINAGAIGVTCAKLSEAEVMVDGGVKDILIANEVVGESKVTRLAYLNRRADVMVAIDDLENAKQISRIAQNSGVKIRILIELNTGMNRCGLQPGPQVVEFSSKIAELPGIVLKGFMSWEGHVVKIEDPDQKKLETEKAVESLVETAQLCLQAGLPVSIVSCGGTGSYMITAHIPGVTEIQAGGGIFGDVTYQNWGAKIQPSLFILATISSHSCPERAVVDAGRKAMNVEYSMPRVKDFPGAELVRCSAEHGILKLDPPIANPKVGDKINLIVGYEDLTVFLHDQLVGVRAGKIEAIWDIQARGKLV